MSAISKLAVLFFALSVSSSAAVKPLSKEIKGKLVNDLPAPYNVQTVTTNRAVALQWQWQPPEQQPLFIDFGYEVLRQDGVHFVVSTPGYADLDLSSGTYVYKVRVRGGSKERGQRINHVSAWSEPVEAVIRLSCEAAPRIDLKVEPTQKSYNNIPALRMHLTGRVISPPSCTLQQVTYHVDAESGAAHAGKLKVDAQGRFNEYVDALGPEDEAPEGATSFTVTVGAENEAGPSTSNAYSIAVQLQNKFAPRQ